jgi:hypothetical protein
VGRLILTKDEVIVRYQKRVHNPLLIAAGFANTDVSVPWMDGKRLRLVFGLTVVLLSLFLQHGNPGRY